MHFCMEEVRMIQAVVTDPHLLASQIGRLFRWIKGLFHATRSEIQGYDIVEVVSEGPPERSLVEILRNPPRLKLLQPTIWEPGNYIYFDQDCVGDCEMCSEVLGLADFVDYDLPLRA